MLIFLAAMTCFEKIFDILLKSGCSSFFNLHIEDSLYKEIQGISRGDNFDSFDAKLAKNFRVVLVQFFHLVLI